MQEECLVVIHSDHLYSTPSRHLASSIPGQKDMQIENEAIPDRWPNHCKAWNCIIDVHATGTTSGQFMATTIIDTYCLAKQNDLCDQQRMQLWWKNRVVFTIIVYKWHIQCMAAYLLVVYYYSVSWIMPPSEQGQHPMLSSSCSQ